MTTTNAQSFNSGGASGHCNKECWDFTIENHVSVAQWIDWEINGTRKDWRVLKPGTYGSDSVDRPHQEQQRRADQLLGRRSRVPES